MGHIDYNFQDEISDFLVPFPFPRFLKSFVTSDFVSVRYDH